MQYNEDSVGGPAGPLYTLAHALRERIPELGRRNDCPKPFRLHVGMRFSQKRDGVKSNWVRVNEISRVW